MSSFAFARVIAGLSLAATMSLCAVGCATEVDGNDPSSSSVSSKVTLTGNVGGGSKGTGTRTFGEVSVSGEDGATAALHVSARELHGRGASGRTVAVAVAGDGSFRVDVARGARWVVTVDDGNGHSALVTFGNGNSAISVSASNNGSASVDVGSIHIVGGEARTDVSFDGTAYGLEATIANLDEVFEAADGAIVAAQEAIAQAKKATEEALKAAASAEQAASEAEKAAAAAAAAAQAAAAAGGKR